MRDFLTGLAILMIVALCAAVAAPFVIDWNSWRAAVEDRASTAIGKPVKITGPLSLRFLPAPALRIGAFQIGADDDHIAAKANKAKIELSVTALLRGEFRITDATIEAPVLTIRADRPGTENTIIVPTLDDVPLAAIDNLHVVDGVIAHVSTTGKTTQPLRGTFTVEATALRGPWRIAGRAVAEERNYDVRISTGELDGTGRIPLKINIADAGLAFIADFDGAAQVDANNRGAVPKVEGRVTASGAFAWPFGKQAGLQPWRLHAQGTSNASGFSASTIEIEAGPQETAFRASGQGKLDMAEGFDATLALKARTIDLDKMRVTDEPQRNAMAQRDIVALMEHALVSPPFPITLALDGDTIIANGEMLGPYRLETRLTRGRFRVERADISAPGQSRLSATGVASLAALPQFDGTIKISSANPGKTWSWLSQTPLDATAAPRFARLRDMVAELPVIATPETITANQFRMTVDGAAITGEGRYRFAKPGTRARVDATINADQLDLDLFPSVQGGSGAAALNYSVAIDARNITARSTGADRLGALTLAIRNDESGLQIERFDLRGGDNARMTGSGKFGTAGGRLETQIDAGNVAPFLIAAQRLFPALALEPVIQRAQTLNPAALAITVQQASASENIAATIAGTIGSTQVDANIGGPARRLPNDKWDAAIERGTVKISTPDFSHFLRQLGATIAAQPQSAAKIPATINLNSGNAFVAGNDLRKRPDWIFDGDIGGLNFSARGVSTEGFVPTGNGPFTLNSSDVAPLLQLFGIMEPERGVAMPMALKGTTEFGLGGLRAQNISGQIGAKEITSGMMHWPFLPDAKLRGQFAFAQFSLADLTAFLLGPEAASGTGLWPSGRFAPARSPLVDFDVEVQTKSMPFGTLATATNASMRIASSPGGIRVPGFGADIAGGRLGFHMTFRNEGTLVSASGRMEAAGTDVAALGVTAFSGKFDTLVDVAGVGESVAQIMQSLGGAGQITTRGLRFPGLDPMAASRVQAQWQGKDPPANMTALTAAIEQELPKAVWAPGMITVPLTITRGAARIGPAQHELNNIAASGQALIDLRAASLNAAVSLSHRDEISPTDIAIAWSGPLSAPKRSVDASTMLNRLQLSAIAREQERISILEQDARERAAFNRRARAERELREAEEAKKRAAEEAQRRADLERRAAEDAMKKAAQERRALEEMARRTSEQQRVLENAVPGLITPPAPAAPLQVTPR